MRRRLSTSAERRTAWLPREGSNSHIPDWFSAFKILREFRLVCLDSCLGDLWLYNLRNWDAGRRGNKTRNVGFSAHSGSYPKQSKCAQQRTRPIRTAKSDKVTSGFVCGADPSPLNRQQRTSEDWRRMSVSCQLLSKWTVRELRRGAATAKEAANLWTSADRCLSSSTAENEGVNCQAW